MEDEKPMQYLPRYLQQAKNQNEQQMTLCKFYAHGYDCPYELQKKDCIAIHLKKIREVHLEALKRMRNNQELTRDEINILIKETDQEETDYTEMKINLYEQYPRAPTEKDIHWLKILQGKDRRQMLFQKYMSKPEQRNTDKKT